MGHREVHWPSESSSNLVDQQAGIRASLYFRPQFSNISNGCNNIPSQSSRVGGESKEWMYEKVELLAHSVVLRPATSVSPGSLLVMQNPGPHPRSPESETLGVKCSNLCFDKPSRWFQCLLPLQIWPSSGQFLLYYLLCWGLYYRLSGSTIWSADWMLKNVDSCFAILTHLLPLVRLRSSWDPLLKKWGEQNQNIGEEL